MKIKKYKAKIAGTSKEVVGYISEIREYLGNGSYGSGTEYLINVTEKSMPDGNYGTFKVAEESISDFLECPVCNIGEQNEEHGYCCSVKCYDEINPPTPN